jgi:hypothetical protein
VTGDLPCITPPSPTVHIPSIEFSYRLSLRDPRLLRWSRSLPFPLDRRSATVMFTMPTTRRATTPKTPKRPRKRRTITIEEFDRDRSKAIAAARKPGGVHVVDSTGKLRFYMVIPHDTIPDVRW